MMRERNFFIVVDLPYNLCMLHISVDLLRNITSRWGNLSSSSIRKATIGYQVSGLQSIRGGKTRLTFSNQVTN